MELTLYSSSFDTSKEEDVFLQSIVNYFKNLTYSDLLTELSVLPIIVSDKEKAIGKGGENFHYSKLCHAAWMAREIDYNTYLNNSLEGRKSLLVKNILICMKLLEKKAKLDYQSFEKDMLEFCKLNNLEVDVSDIKDIVKKRKESNKRNKDELYWTIKVSETKQEYEDNQDGYSIIDDYFTLLEMEDTKYIRLSPSLTLNDIFYLKAYLDKKDGSVTIEAHLNDSTIYTNSNNTIGEALDIFVEFYSKHQLDLSKWVKNNK